LLSVGDHGHGCQGAADHGHGVLALTLAPHGMAPHVICLASHRHGGYHAVAQPRSTPVPNLHANPVLNILVAGHVTCTAAHSPWLQLRQSLQRGVAIWRQLSTECCVATTVVKGGRGGGGLTLVRAGERGTCCIPTAVGFSPMPGGPTMASLLPIPVAVIRLRILER
jgi:hypothetical protein